MREVHTACVSTGAAIHMPYTIRVHTLYCTDCSIVTTEHVWQLLLREYHAKTIFEMLSYMITLQ